MVTVLIKWVTGAVRDYTLGLYHPEKISIYECVGYGTGTQDLPDHVWNKCTSLRIGDSYMHGDEI